MQTPVMPAGMPAPAANYAHAVLTENPVRWLHTSGVVPVATDGTTPVGVGAQAVLVWQHIAVLLADVGMQLSDVVSITTYVVIDAIDPGLSEAMSARDAAIGGRFVASTLVTVPALAQPQWLLEIAVVAAA